MKADSLPIMARSQNNQWQVNKKKDPKNLRNLFISHTAGIEPETLRVIKKEFTDYLFFLLVLFFLLYP